MGLCCSRIGRCDFNSRSPCGERHDGGKVRPAAGEISTHAPRVGSDPDPHPTANPDPNFNSRSPCGERLDIAMRFSGSFIFQLTLPVWGATRFVEDDDVDRGISTHAPRVGSDPPPRSNSPIRTISTHAPRVGSDTHHRQTPSTLIYFNSRSPCGERPVLGNKTIFHNEISTHAPRVGSDISIRFLRILLSNFNSRSPCGERPPTP